MTAPARRVLQSPLRLAVLPLARLALGGPSAAVVRLDVDRWAAVRSVPGATPTATLVEAFVKYPEFRSLLYARLAYAGALRKLVAGLYRILLRPQVALTLDCPALGAGLVLLHGDGTFLRAHAIGANVTVQQQVTLGARSAGTVTVDLPTIGDDVFIGVGARVLGAVRVGDGARIGANAVVLHDVPAGATVVGAPARVVTPR